MALSIDLGVRQAVIRPTPKYTCKNSFQRKLDVDTQSALNSNTLSVIGVGSVMRLADIPPPGDSGEVMRF